MTNREHNTFYDLKASTITLPVLTTNCVSESQPFPSVQLKNLNKTHHPKKLHFFPQKYKLRQDHCQVSCKLEKDSEPGVESHVYDDDDDHTLCYCYHITITFAVLQANNGHLYPSIYDNNSFTRKAWKFAYPSSIQLLVLQQHQIDYKHVKATMNVL